MEIDKTNIFETNLSSIMVKEKHFFNIIKRIIDILLSSLGLIFLVPMTLIIAILIKIDDPKGKVFFSQNRVGKNEEIFKMYKFRSMYSNAEERLESILKYNEIHGAMFKMKEDPRITRIGKYLRKTSLDELPQFFNVLKGNMSLIGPRPPLLQEVELYSLYDKQRLLIRPGITGLWQVSGRNSLSFHQMVELDIEYIKNRSILNDMKILLKTVIVVIKSSDAY
ncbi:sugar transferase [Carnobacterium inhibens]|uniref:Multidrug MFS transporter n=1 Tax=Carnobacterium inhibens subsp. gilichinskyi TaxID=1266845 RepID=U5S9N0_9LACT|nr:sugar transferase [Carnobacterium inhibens]AGY81960.1 multidrug MFS transporter [Carnobacterium inhibens subsp. gilichinskyi]